MRLLYVVLCLVCFFWQSCNSLREIDLYFTSNNCDEEPRRITEDKTYNLTWHGQISPKLCSFSFTTSSSYEVCFVSLVYDLPSSMGNVKIKIKNYTRSSYEFDRFDRNIPRTCVKRAYKMNISIIVPTGYIPPSPNIYLQLEVTAVLVEVVSLTILSIVLGTIFGIVFVCCICIGVGKGSNFDACGGECSCLRDICETCGGIVRCCLKCECLRGCDCPTSDCPSCDCDCQDICKPCGECCTAWAGCCTSVIISARQTNSNNEQSNVQAEMDAIPHDTGHTSSAASGYIEQPPSYHSVKGFLAVAGIIFRCCKKGILCDLCDSCLSRAFCCKRSHSAQDEIAEMSDIQGASFSEHSFVSPTEGTSVLPFCTA